MAQVDRRECGAYGAAFRTCYRRFDAVAADRSLGSRRADAFAALLTPQRDRLAASRGCAAGRASAEYALMHPPGRASANERRPA
jgi:hypothetical protein